MKQVILLAAAIVATAGLAGAQAVRAGVFDKQALVVAFYRSPQWAVTLNAKVAERDAAKRSGDTAKTKELESWGQDHQDLSHRQLMGEAPIANILEALAPAFPEIARTAGVSLIAADLTYADSTVTKVDVTDAIMTYLKADERTLAIVHDLQKHRQ